MSLRTHPMKRRRTGGRVHAGIHATDGRHWHDNDGGAERGVFHDLLVAGNTMAQAVRERTEELGVLKAMGFTNELVLALVLVESCVIAAVGGMAGLGLASCSPRVGVRAGVVARVLFAEGDMWSSVVGLVVALGIVAGILPASRPCACGSPTHCRGMRECGLFNWLSQVFRSRSSISDYAGAQGRGVRRGGGDCGGRGRARGGALDLGRVRAAMSRGHGGRGDRVAQRRGQRNDERTVDARRSG